MKPVGRMVVVILAMAMVAGGAFAQSALVDEKPTAPLTVQTFYLTNVSQQNDATELTVTLRNLLDPRVKMYLVPSQNAIVMQGTTEQIALARKLLNDLDRPKKTYRLTYTITQLEDGKRIGTQHFSMIVVTGQQTRMKQGSRVPLMVGGTSEGGAAQSQTQYVDIGLSFHATLDEFANGVRLRSNVEQSSVAEEKSGLGPQDPVIRQTLLEGTSFLAPGRPLMLGSLDVPGTTRRMDIEVVMEQVVQ